MRWYWFKITLGALLVFGLGLAAVSAVRAGISRGRSVFESSDPISIPLALIPFTLEGREIGTFQRVVILRDAPKVISGVEVRIRMRDSAPGMDLADCRVTPTDRRNFDLHEGFICLRGEQVDSSLVAFGTIRFGGPEGITVPLVLDSAAVNEMRRQETAVTETRARITDQAARVEAERISTRVRLQADSIAKAVRSRVEQSTKAPVPPE
jgi:hypothetical protein